MHIKEVEITNILGLRHCHVKFDKQITILQSDADCPIRHSLSTAIKLICSSKYAELSSLSDLPDIHRGSVRLTLYFAKTTEIEEEIWWDDLHAMNEVDTPEEILEDSLPSTSQQARERMEMRRQHRRLRLEENLSAAYYKISALRNFTKSPELIQYSVNDGPMVGVTVLTFHGRFHTNIDFMYPRLRKMQEQFIGVDLLEFITTEISKNAVLCPEKNNPFATFIELFVKGNLNVPHILSQITQAVLLGNRALNSMQWTQAVKICQDMRCIFEFLTCQMYTIWFYIVRDDKNIEITELSSDDYRMRDVSIFIQTKDSSDQVHGYSYQNVEPTIQSKVIMAFQLSVALHCNQKVVYLNHLDVIAAEESMALATHAYLKEDKHVEDDESKSSQLGFGYTRNYLQRIVNICTKINCWILIEYPGLVPVETKLANIVKCVKAEQSGSIGDGTSVGEWSMMIMEEHHCNWKCMKGCIRAGIKFY